MSTTSAALVFALALTAASFSAGCLGAFTGARDGADPGAAAVARARDMLANPPGAGVRETGKVHDLSLYLHRMTHEVYPGATMQMWAFGLEDDPASASVPGPEIRVTEGDRLRVTFRSLVAGFNHTIHWHGQHVPWEQDGVPFVSHEPIPPGEGFVYDFVAKPAGTYWYHCHVDAQHHIDMGMYGALIVEPQDPAADPPFDRETTLFLDDMDRYHLEGGQQNAGNQPQSGDPFEYATWAERQAQDTLNRNPQVSDRVTGTPLREPRSWYPVTYPPYTPDYNTFLINGMAFPYTQPIVVAEGETLRVRLANAGNSIHAMHLHGHHVLVTHKDGVLLASPYWADTILIGPGERYDFHVLADNPGVWELHDHIGRHSTNDDIFPGGAMTMFVYEAFADRVQGGGHHGDGGWTFHPFHHAGAYVRWYRVLA